MALNSGIQTYQILTNDDEVCIPSLYSIFLAAPVISKYLKFISQNYIFKTLSKLNADQKSCEKYKKFIKRAHSRTFLKGLCPGSTQKNGFRKSASMFFYPFSILCTKSNQAWHNGIKFFLVKHFFWSIFYQKVTISTHITLLNKTSRNESSCLWYLPLFWPVRQSEAAVEHNLSLLQNTPIREFSPYANFITAVFQNYY